MVYNTQNNKPLIVLTGPTAVGKTALSISLAKQVGGEIISADSMQVYKRMDIGSAKITKEEMQGVVHHLIDILEPTEEFNIVKFKEYALKAMDEIYDRGHIPIVTGGTGFYIQALLYDISFEPHEEESQVRSKYEEIASKEGGIHTLHEMLANVDPVYAQETHENNVKRIIRALEFYDENGIPLSQHNAQQRQKTSPYSFAYFVLTDDRTRLYERIDQRVDQMLSQGLVNEVKALKEEGLSIANLSMQGLGYKEILAYLDGEISLDEAIYIIKRDTRHFAKRQLTWFRREHEVQYLDRGQLQTDKAILDEMLRVLQEKKIYERG